MRGSRREYGLLFARLYSDDGMHMAARAVPDIDHDLRYAVDDTGRRHLLLAVDHGFAFQPIHGDVLRLQDMNDPRDGSRYMDLSCEGEAQAEVFSSLVDDVVSRLQQVEHRPEDELLTALANWQALLKPARELSRERRLGIFGELTILRRLASINPHWAVDRWTGPSGGLHDFSTPGMDLDVKATSAEGLTVTISSLDQLDAREGFELDLVRARIVPASDGQTLGELVEEIVDCGVDRSTLIQKLVEAGFRYGIDEDDERFVLADEPRAWRVDDDFPGLRTVDIPEARRSAISKVSYTLDLNTAPESTRVDLNEVIDRLVTNS